MIPKLTRRAWIRALLFSGIAITGGVGYVSSKKLERVHADIPLVDLPKELDGFKVGVLSDFHAGAFTTKEEIDRAVRMVREESPDLIALLGDYVDGAYSHSPKNVEKGSYVFDALGSLKGPLGTYAVLGNHDHWTDADLVREKLSMLPVVILDNQGLALDNGLAVVGVDDYWEGPSDALRALRTIKPESVVVMLSHNPDVNIQLRGDRLVRLVISGHTHGGQIRVPFINWAPWVPCSMKYRGCSGLIKETDRRWTFITKGIGTFFVPIRLACPPDVAILRLRRA
ncbi:MAG: metallophosphoesterase [Deltaproteobacteria bacterium]|nr:metallophosphoesterase [Deltaproteobacteria bacterium]MBW2078416.1 metallophosphoesterase [Deltaproteobacteria bacterium]